MYHVPVLLEKAVELLVTDRNGLYVDGTLGGGNHTRAILEKLASGGRVAGFDQDMDAINYSRVKLKRFGDRFFAIHSNFADIGQSLAQHGALARRRHPPGGRGNIARSGIAARLGLIDEIEMDGRRGLHHVFHALKEVHHTRHAQRVVDLGAALFAFH